MNNHIKSLILGLLLISQLILSGQEKNFITDSIKALDFAYEGINLARSGMYAEALEPYMQALEIRKKIYNKDEYGQFASLYRLLAMNYKNLGFYDMAIQYSKLAEQAFIKGYGKNYWQIALVYENLGNVYRNKLNYNDALTYFKQMLSIYQNQEATNQSDLAAAYYNIARIYFLLYNHKEAINLIKQHINDAYDSDKILFYDLLGAIYQELNKNQEAIEYYQKAIQKNIELYSDKDIGLASEYMNFAYFLIQIGETNQAMNELEKARSIISLYDKKGGGYYSSYYRNMGILAENKHIESKNINEFKIQRNKNLLEAINYYKKALQALNFPSDITSYVNLRLDTINNISDMECLDLLKLIGNAYLEVSNIYEGENKERYNYNIDIALNYYKVAGTFVQQIRKEISGDESKILLAEQEQSTFTSIVKTSYLAYKTDGDIEHLKLAFTNAERLKSGSIFDKLEETLARDNSLIPDSLQQKEKLLNSRITNYKEQRFNETTSANPDSSVIAYADSILLELNKERLELNTYLENNYSNYYDLKYSNSLYELEDIQHKLKDDEVLIEYILNETDTLPELYSILIERNKTKFRKQTIDNQFIKNIESAFHFMSTPRYMFTTNEDTRLFLPQFLYIISKID